MQPKTTLCFAPLAPERQSLALTDVAAAAAAAITLPAPDHDRPRAVAGGPLGRHRLLLRPHPGGVLGAVAVPPVLNQTILYLDPPRYRSEIFQILYQIYPNLKSRLFQILASSCFGLQRSPPAAEPGLVLLGEVASELGSLVGVRTASSFLVSSDRGIVIGT